ncbi:MAG: peroxiredoxin, partial [Candidatus Dojkabacteria bacterium]|nr:peroxiredoxin [Candidatus Dojkabacteria bacterium]
MTIKLNQKAPDFSLKDQEGKIHRLSDYRGKWVLIYFYPKDFTPGCTLEACNIRNNFSEFTKLGIVVIGISSDSIDSHKKFAQKYNLPFILLSDEGREIARKYGAIKQKKIMGLNIEGTSRISFLIDPEG